MIRCLKQPCIRTSRIHIKGTISCYHALIVTEYDTTVRFDVLYVPYSDKDLEEDLEEGLEQEQA
jgi:hypothetical protein